MNPLAAALLAAQGWDVSGLRKQSAQRTDTAPDWGQSSDSTSSSSIPTDNALDINALLKNPAILQALSTQMSGSAASPQASGSGYWQPEGNTDQDKEGGGNVTPGQTTRFGRVSRPPVAPPPQAQLALLQQILRGSTGTDSQPSAGPSNQSQNASRSRRQSVGTERQSSTTNTATVYTAAAARSYTQPQAPRQSGSASARVSGAKRLHSTLRESSLPPRSMSPELENRSRETSDEPLVRPIQPTQSWGRPKKGESTTKEERAQRRKIQNSLSAADYRKKKEMYIKSLEDRVEEKEKQVKAKSQECEVWRQKCVDLEKQYVLNQTEGGGPAGYSLPNEDGSVQANDRFLPSTLPNQRQPSRPSGLRNAPDGTSAPAISPAALNPPIRSPIPLPSANNTPSAYPSPALQSVPLASSSTTLAAGLSASNHPTMSPINHPTLSPHNTYPGSSPIETPDGTPFDLGVDLSAFDDFFNWDIMPDNDADDQQDADFVPASSPRRDSDSDEEESDGEGHMRKKTKRTDKGKTKSKQTRPRNEDDDEFVDPEVDEEDLFMPITDVEVPPGQMQLVEKAAQDVMSTFGVDSQAQLSGVMQKIVDAGEGLTGEQLEKLKSVLRWMHSSGRLPGGQL